jgi:hypothetical protein
LVSLNGDKTCLECRFEKKGRPCPIAMRLHTPNWDKKMWALNRTNFGCILWEPYQRHERGGSVLDKLDHTRRLELASGER